MMMAYIGNEGTQFLGHRLTVTVNDNQLLRSVAQSLLKFILASSRFF